jgi:lipopolysaccharide transport system ATP-binding protein
MGDVVIRVENLSKQYRLGTISHGTLYQDLQSGWAKCLGKEDPNARIGSVNTGPLNNRNDRFWALKDISFDVRQGEIVGIIGRNGAGKSTLLKILSRVTAPTEGSVKIRGRVASLLEVGTGFHPELTGSENIFLNGAILGMRKGEIEQKFDEIVKFSEIEKFIDTPVKRYSSGMYVRLAFAVAAHLDPEILLVDEVLAVGDAAFQKKCLGKMGSITNEGKTILFVSHNMAAIQKLCRTGILLEEGRIAVQGDIARVTDAYLQQGSGNQLSWERGETISPEAYFEKIYFCNDQGERLNQITPDGTVNLVIEFALETAIDKLQIAFHLSNKFDEPLYSSIPEDFDGGTPHERGRYIAKIRLPNEFFLFQNYSVTFSLYIPGVKSIERITPVQFSVTDVTCWHNRFLPGRVGYLAIPLAWKIDKK